MTQLHRLATVSLVLAFLSVAGCASNNVGKIEGTKWETTAQSIDGKDIPAGALTLEFTKDGKLIFIAGPEQYEGTYSLGMGDYVTFNLNKEIDGRKNQLEVITINGDNLTMVDSNSETMEFRKIE